MAVKGRNFPYTIVVGGAILGRHKFNVLPVRPVYTGLLC